MQEEKTHLGSLLEYLGEQDLINLKNAEDAVALASRESTTENIKAAQAAVEELTQDQVAANPDLQRAIEAAKLVRDQLTDPSAEGITAAKASIADVTNETNNTALTAQIEEAERILVANKWKTDNSEILGKEVANVTEDDRAAINKAISEYVALQKEVRDKLVDERSKLSNMLTKLNDDADLNAAIEAVKQAAISSTDTTIARANSALEELTPTQITDNPDLQRAIDAAKAVKDALATPNTDTIAVANAAKDLVMDPNNKAALEAQIAKAQGVLDAEKFKTAHADILSKSVDSVAADDKIALDAALTAYDALTDEAKALLGTEKQLLDDLKAELEAEANLAAAKEAVAMASRESNADNIKAAEEALGKLSDQQKTDNPDLQRAIDAAKAVELAKASLTVENIESAKTAVDKVENTTNKSALEQQIPKTTAETTDVSVPTDKVPVSDIANLTEAEKAAVKKAIEDANAALPADTTITVGNDGTVTITYADESTDTIPGADVVRAKTTAEENTPTPTATVTTTAANPQAEPEGVVAKSEITGKTEPNASVTVKYTDKEGQEKTVTATADEDGNYTAALPTDLAEGTALTVIAKDGEKAESDPIEPKPVVLVDKSKAEEAKTAFGNLGIDSATSDPKELAAITALNALDQLLKEGAKPSQKEIDDATKALNNATAEVNEVDKTELQTEINKEATVRTSDAYKNATSEEQNAYDAALEVAKNVNNDSNATQEAVNKAKNDLVAATSGLSGQPTPSADKTGLKESIDKAKDLNIDPTTEDPEDKSVQEALAKANDVFDNPGATQDEINTAKENLDDAIAKKDATDKLDISKKELERLISDETNVIEGDAYKNSTLEAQQDYDGSITRGQGVLNNPNVTQAEVDAAIKEIDSALQNLGLEPAKPNKEKLLDAIKDGESVQNSSKYNDVPTSIRESLDSAIENGLKVLNDPDATEAQIIDGTNQIRRAIDSIRRYAPVEPSYPVFPSIPSPIAPAPVAPVKPVQTTKIVEKYINGYSDGTFKPNGQITRGEAAAMYARLLTGNNLPVGRTNFSDLAENSWYKDAIAYMVNNSYMRGYEDGNFRPEQPITRAEFSQMISKGLSGEQMAPFTDIDGHWAKTAIEAVYSNGVIKGYEDGSFKPNNPITRAESVAMFNRLFKRSTTASNLSTLTNKESLVKFSDIEGSWAYYDIIDASNTREQMITGGNWITIK